MTGDIEVETQAASLAGQKRKTPSPEDGTDEALSWRLPAGKSHSDWTIEIIFDSDDGKDDDDDKPRASFPVHRNILSVGPKRCLYFVRLFQNRGFAEALVRTSRIALREPAAALFPNFLDYLYAPDNHEDAALAGMTAETVAAWHFLAQYFGVAPLEGKCRAFWEENMTHDSDTLATYYKGAQLFHDESIKAAVADVTWKALLAQEKVNSKLMEASDTELWLAIVQKNVGGAASDALSQAIAEFGTNNRDKLDADTLTQLTDPKYLPTVGWEAALNLLWMEKKVLKMATLQDRCVAALALHWDLVGSRDLAQSLVDLGPRIFRGVMEQFSQCKKQLGQCQKRLERAQRSLPAFIVVEGAGIAAVNGTYTHDASSYSNDAPMFTMQGEYFDGPAEFKCFLSTAKGGSDLYWWITTEPMVDNGMEQCVFLSNPPNRQWRLPASACGVEDAGRCQCLCRCADPDLCLR